MIDPKIFYILRILLFFAVTPFVYRALQSLDIGKLFRNDDPRQIRLLLIVVAFIVGFLFVDAVVSLFENLNSFLA
jgi:uncharacterized membrane protein YwzB